MTHAQASPLQIYPEATPNPASVRFVLNRPVLEEGTAEFKTAEAAEGRSPLAAKLFMLAAVRGVFLGSDFVTVTAAAGVDWNNLAASVIDTIKAHCDSGEAALVGAPDPAESAPAGEKSAIAEAIEKIIAQEIRPAVAMDGGDVVFREFRDGVVYLSMRGSCHGCPSALMTLKMGIERRLQEDFPEIREVKAI
jgi:Fe-S cluster biogenesis protein NfuA